MAEKISAEALNYMTMGIQSEIAAYVFYKIGAEKTADSKLKATMLHFADEERKHFFALEHQHDQYVRSEKWVSTSHTLSRDELPPIDESVSQEHLQRIERVRQATLIVDILQIALEMEREAYALYSEAAKASATPDVVKTFQSLAGFELGHIRNVEEMMAGAGA